MKASPQVRLHHHQIDLLLVEDLYRITVVANLDNAVGAEAAKNAVDNGSRMRIGIRQKKR